MKEHFFVMQQKIMKGKPESFDLLELHVSTIPAQDSKNKFRIYHQVVNAMAEEVMLSSLS